MCASVLCRYIASCVPLGVKERGRGWEGEGLGLRYGRLHLLLCVLIDCKMVNITSVKL